MELCTAPAISNLPHRRLLASNYTHLQWKASLPLKQPSFPRTQPGLRYYTNSSLRSTTSEETSSGPTQYVGEEPGRSTTSEETSSGPTQYVGEEPGVVTVEDVQPVEKNSFAEIEQKEVPKEDSAMDGQFLAFEFLDKLDIKLDSEDTYSVLLFGSGALVALWIGTAIVTAIDSIPLFPKLLEVVGLAYTLWFSTRYLIFKKNREELVSKIEEIKQQVLGSTSD